MEKKIAGSIDESFYREKYNSLVGALREKDILIVNLQRECAEMQNQLTELQIFRNILGSCKQFFGLMLNTKKIS